MSDLKKLIYFGLVIFTAVVAMGAGAWVVTKLFEY